MISYGYMSSDVLVSLKTCYVSLSLSLSLSPARKEQKQSAAHLYLHIMESSGQSFTLRSPYHHGKDAWYLVGGSQSSSGRVVEGRTLYP